MSREPKSLQEAIVYFSKPDNCIDYLAACRWPNGVVCPTCGSEKVKYNPARRWWQCSSHHAKRQFSIKVGTIYEDSPIGLDKWLTATWMLTNCKNGVSSYEIARALTVTQKSAWFMLHRIRLALQDDATGGKLSGQVEVDETFIGGKARNMHLSKKRGMNFQKRGGVSKTVVIGMMERGGMVRAQIIPERDKTILHAQILANVEEGSELFTDEWGPYSGLTEKYIHEVINHAEEYVRGNVHTNGIENFWSLLKRGLHGTYVSVEPFHLFRYIDEQAFRYNNRKDGRRKITDSERFNLAISNIVNKRLTFAQVTGKVGAAAAF
jgi:transposase-like protein